MNKINRTAGFFNDAPRKCSSRPIAMMVIVSILISVRWAVADPSGDSSVTDAESGADYYCIPEILIVSRPERWKLCLNRMAPDDDSCVEVTISGQAAGGAVIHFQYTEDGKWHYAGMQSVESADRTAPVKVYLTNDPAGDLLRVSIFPAAGSDTTPLLSAPRVRNDRPDTADTASPSNLTVRRMVHNCNRVEYKVVIEERVYTYPPGFRRDPVLNYPELSMFHYGGSVRMPTANSLQEWADLYSFYHMSNPDELTFDDPEEIIKAEAWLTRYSRRKPVGRDRPKKRRRPPMIRFRPLQ
ncbi:MAG: hypothetical protein JXA18_14810 [Chitinispirillaceae bacterium]|nr:hypothetical protein [Chitinispirillaceae bacterium]